MKAPSTQGDTASSQRLDSAFVRAFIMQHDFAGWGPGLEGLLSEALTAAGIVVDQCLSLPEHPVMRVRLRCSPELELRAIKRRIRKVTKSLGYRVPVSGMAITGHNGKFGGAFVMESQFGRQPGCSEILP